MLYMYIKASNQAKYKDTLRLNIYTETRERVKSDTDSIRAWHYSDSHNETCECAKNAFSPPKWQTKHNEIDFLINTEARALT